MTSVDNIAQFCLQYGLLKGGWKNTLLHFGKVENHGGPHDILIGSPPDSLENKGTRKLKCFGQLRGCSVLFKMGNEDLKLHLLFGLSGKVIDGYT